ncbi:hypothetical protein [Engelhardtia mirabilis]|uniref:hypothetical protein n=1 Tax=Engelhardtia mirabilis TaxID=2528011 RepID=UPI003AF39F3B
MGATKSEAQDVPVLYPDPGGVWEAFGPMAPSNAIEARFYDVKTFSSKDIWSVGSFKTGSVFTSMTHGWVMHFDENGTWNEVPIPVFPIQSGGSVRLEGIDGTSASDLWVFGSHDSSNLHPGPNSLPLVMHFDGVSWEIVSVPASPAGVTAVFLDDVESAGTDEVWFAGWGFAGVAVPIALQWNGTELVAHDLPPAFPFDRIARAVTIAGPNDVWVVGGGNVASQGYANAFSARFNGSSWTEFPVPQLGNQRELRSIAALSPTMLWATGEAKLQGGAGQAYDLRFDGSVWTQVDSLHALGNIRRTPLGTLRGTGRFASQYFSTGWYALEDFPATFGEQLPLASTRAVDGGADGSLVAVGFAFPSSGFVPVALRRNPDCAARTFDDGSDYPLDLDFSPTTGSAAGSVQLEGASPGATGIFVVSAEPGLLDLGFGNILVDVGPAASFLSVVSFDAGGLFSVPLSLDQPGIAGQSFYMQGGELGSTVRLSNGLHLLGCP